MGLFQQPARGAGNADNMATVTVKVTRWLCQHVNIATPDPDGVPVAVSEGESVRGMLCRLAADRGGFWETFLDAQAQEVGVIPPVMTLSPTSGKIGDKITVTGQNFQKSAGDGTSDKYAVLFFSNQAATTDDDIDTKVTTYAKARDGIYLDANGRIADFQPGTPQAYATFTVPTDMSDGAVPSSISSGTYYLYLCYYGVAPIDTTPTIAARIRAVATFTVLGGRITLSPYQGQVGSTLQITGTQFIGNQAITIQYDSNNIGIMSGDSQTSGSGGFVSNILIP